LEERKIARVAFRQHLKQLSFTKNVIKIKKKPKNPQKIC